MNDTTGLVVPEDLMKSAASSSAVPPISPIMMIPSVWSSLTNCSRQSTKLVPLNGSPPVTNKTDHVSQIAYTRELGNKRTDAHARGLTEADLRGLEHRFVGECAGS